MYPPYYFLFFSLERLSLMIFISAAVISSQMGYKELIEKFDMTQDAVAKTVGRSRSYIANAVRILALPERIISLLENGEISIGHAKALL